EWLVIYQASWDLWGEPWSPQLMWVTKRKLSWDFPIIQKRTLGHMAPESFLDNGCLTTKADVFSFGIAVLETISGYKINNEIPGTNKCYGTIAIAFDMFVELMKVWSNWIEGTYTNIIDPWIEADSSIMTSSSIDLPIPNEPRWAITNDLDDVYASEPNDV
nr:concanavalin A-like lectin/glucanase domain, serine/threonine-protein kinase Rad53 [Tanacetum cinerariifolium]